MLENGTNVELKKGENTYIYNFDAYMIYKSMTEDVYSYKGEKISEKGNHTTKGVSYNKLFTATIPYSLEMIRLDERFNDEIYVMNGKQYTKAVVNLRFDSNYSEWRDKRDKKGNVILDEEGKPVRDKYLKANKKTMRKFLYKNGLVIDGQRYIFYKRGASKARTGSCLFIKEEMYKDLMDRSRLIHNNPKHGLYFEEGEVCDITSLNAYQSLILSGIEDIVSIPKEAILIVDDIESEEFNVVSSVTTEVNGELRTETKEVTRVNNMTDGQGLLDESIFEQVGRECKGMMLLRNDLFKCCAFNTKLQKFFEHMEGIGKIKDGKILDKYRGWVNYKDIKLVTTPSSVKYLKFKGKFPNEQECYMGWYENIDDVFGIVKSDKSGNYGSWNRATYQIINSMPFTKEQLKELLKPELEYLDKLRTDISYFRNHIAVSEKITKTLETDIENMDWDCEEDDSIDDKRYASGEMINNILSINSDFQHTKVFKQFRLDQINCYVDELRKGKFRLENTIYSTIVANPYEMLLHTLGLFDGKCLAKGYEIYCKSYEDGQELATFRNPHINSGNVMLAKNVWHEEYKWFNFSNNITIVNVSDNDFPDRGQGFDYDSDTLLHIPHKLFVEVARDCQKYKTPLNAVKGDSKVRRNSLEELAELDDILSNNFIGKIINKSQIVNSYMWDCKAKGKSEELVNKLYDISSMLSSLSQIELDKAKKSFDNVSMPTELRNINDMQFEGESVINFLTEETGNVKPNGELEIVKKMIVPTFFKYVARCNTYRILEKFETPMDYLEEILDEFCKKRTVRKTKNIGELMVKAKTLEGDVVRREHHNKVYDLCLKYNSRINFLRMNDEMNDKLKKYMMKRYKEELLEGLNKINISAKTIYSIINKCFGENKKEQKWSKIGMIVLVFLHNSKHKLKLLTVFKNENNIDEEILFRSEEGDINIFGERYVKIKRKELINI